jgi:hypothetical protein
MLKKLLNLLRRTSEMKYKMTIINYADKRQLTMMGVRALDLDELEELQEEVIWDDYILSEATKQKFIIEIEMVKYEKKGWVRGARFMGNGRVCKVKSLKYVDSHTRCGSIMCRAHYEEYGSHMAVEFGELSMLPIDKCELL